MTGMVTRLSCSRPDQLARPRLLADSVKGGMLVLAVGVDIGSPGLRSPSLGELRIHNLEVAGATVDLLLVRHEHDVGVDVLRREVDVQILVVK